MVNLKKWEVIEHDDVRVDDLLKIIEVEHTIKGPSTVTVYKRTVTSLDDNLDFYLSDGTAWENVDPTPDNETVTVYRRKQTPEVVFTFPQNLGAVIEGESRRYGAKKRFVWDEKGWNYSGFPYNHIQLKELYKNFVVLSEGVKA